MKNKLKITREHCFDKQVLLTFLYKNKELSLSYMATNMKVSIYMLYLLYDNFTKNKFLLRNHLQSYIEKRTLYKINTTVFPVKPWKTMEKKNHMFTNRILFIKLVHLFVLFRRGPLKSTYFFNYNYFTFLWLLRPLVVFHRNFTSSSVTNRTAQRAFSFSPEHWKQTKINTLRFSVGIRRN